MQRKTRKTQTTKKNIKLKLIKNIYAKLLIKINKVLNTKMKININI